MKRLFVLFAIAVAAAGFTSCDSHPWEETKVLHDAYSEHGKAHGEPGHEAAGGGHEAKPAEGHGEKKH